MSQTNSSILRGFFDEVLNERRLDLLSKYLSEEYVGHGTPYVGIGVVPDPSSGEKIVIQAVKPGGPADGKLKVGDELVRVLDGQRTWDTFEELRQPAWGQGVLNTPLTVWVRREGEERQITLVRGLVQGFEFPYHLIEAGTREFFEEWPDLQIRLINAIEAGDLVAYHAENQGHNSRFGRSAVWAEFGFVRIQHGKITDWWSTEDTYAQFKQMGYTIEEPALAKK
jgi:predicted SnoaL-like aldol condensation-catalyzing enzyme